MKSKMKRSLGMASILFTLALLPFLAQAFSVKEVATKAKLPSSDWTWDKDYKGSDVLVGMYVIKLGKAVSIRANSYDYPYSPKRYLEGVREKLMEKTEYKGGEFRLPENKIINGKEWAYFKLKRKDEINQELWALRDNTGNILFVIFTTAGDDYFSKYYPDLSNFIQQVSNL